MTPPERRATHGSRWLAPAALAALLAAGALIARQVITTPAHLSVRPNVTAEGTDVPDGVRDDVPADAAAAELHGFVLSPALPAPDVRAWDTAGAPWDLAERRGKVVALFFGYTTCPDVCPQTLALLAAAKAALGDGSNALDVAMITVDPERDTPDVLGRYMAGFDPSFVGLEAGDGLPAIADAFGTTYTRDLPPDVATRAAQIAGHDEAAGDGHGGAADLPDDDHSGDAAAGDDDRAAGSSALGHNAGVPGGFEPGSPAYTVAHSGVVFLIDPEGRLRSSYLAPFDPAELAADVNVLVSDHRAAKAR
ncbi:MAG: SCO family protein [Ardenticatenales bacterium]|nr:SCO family protein [Ardenticatenales bacterium]